MVVVTLNKYFYFRVDQSAFTYSQFVIPKQSTTKHKNIWHSNPRRGISEANARASISNTLDCHALVVYNFES
jgi:hypothetical protein